MKPSTTFLAVAALAHAFCTMSHAENWMRFRGENGAGIASDAAATPIEWSESKNVRWSAPLPGPGKSSPIVVGDRVVVSCWTGDNPPDDLKRRLLCFDRASGEPLWAKEIVPAVRDEPFVEMFTENGYASHTPVSDGQRIYAFFGLGGVIAFDMDGNEVWRASVGEGTDPNRWGSASSPILYDDKVIVTAAAESTAIVALNKATGTEVWKQEGEGLASCWGTPVLADAGEGKPELVIAVPGEIWGMNPDTGKLRWFVAGSRARAMCASAVAQGDVVYVMGGRDGEAIAVRAGGKGDARDSHVLWADRGRGAIGTPVVADGLLYSIAGGVATCLDAATGDVVYEKRLQPPKAPAAGSDEQAREAQPPSRRSGFRQQDYGSPVVADGKIYFVRRNGDAYVLATGREFKQLAVNRFASDEGDFSATPAISDGEIFIRSSNKLYCVSER